MMISAAKLQRNRQRGFTLLEIVIVLVIIAVSIGGAVGMMVYSSDERTLRAVSGDIEVLAKRARTISILHQTPYALEFRPGSVRLLPLAEAGSNALETSLGRSIGGQLAEQMEPDRRQPVREVVEIGEDMEMSIRRWNSDVLQTINERSIHIWRFDPDGLCEPVSVRLNLGESWYEDTYHPLTASVHDTTFEIR